jgi:hypothetical protein
MIFERLIHLKDDQKEQREFYKKVTIEIDILKKTEKESK